MDFVVVFGGTAMKEIEHPVKAFDGELRRALLIDAFLVLQIVNLLEHFKGFLSVQVALTIFV